MPGENRKAEKTQLERKKIFCVNGSPEFLDILRDLFQSEEYNVTTTNYVPRTFDIVDALQPDLVILDLVIGHRSGFELLQQLSTAASTRGLPVIITSTNQQLLDQVERNPERYGETVQVLKPLDLDALLETVRRLIDPA